MLGNKRKDKIRKNLLCKHLQFISFPKTQISITVTSLPLKCNYCPFSFFSFCIFHRLCNKTGTSSLPFSSLGWAAPLSLLPQPQVPLQAHESREEGERAKGVGRGQGGKGKAIWASQRWCRHSTAALPPFCFPEHRLQSLVSWAGLPGGQGSPEWSPFLVLLSPQPLAWSTALAPSHAL